MTSFIDLLRQMLAIIEFISRSNVKKYIKIPRRNIYFVSLYVLLIKHNFTRNIIVMRYVILSLRPLKMTIVR